MKYILTLLILLTGCSIPPVQQDTNIEEGSDLQSSSAQNQYVDPIPEKPPEPPPSKQMLNTWDRDIINKYYRLIDRQELKEAYRLKKKGSTSWSEFYNWYKDTTHISINNVRKLLTEDINTMCHFTKKKSSQGALL